MSMTTEIFGDVIVAHAPDELGGEHIEGIEEFLAGLDRLNIVLDLDGSESIASKGLTALLDAQDQIRQLGGELKISTSNHVNRKIFEITRLDQQFEVFPNVMEAVKSFC